MAYLDCLEKNKHYYLHQKNSFAFKILIYVKNSRLLTLYYEKYTYNYVTLSTQKYKSRNVVLLKSIDNEFGGKCCVKFFPLVTRLVPNLIN